MLTFPLRQLRVKELHSDPRQTYSPAETPFDPQDSGWQFRGDPSS